MKIKKIKKIDSLALYSNFEWDKAVKDSAGNVICFKSINIIYGRNYSGKTTLSRIFRYFEDGYISSYYENPSFTLEMENGKEVVYPLDEGKKNMPLPVRVYNEDFCLENLSFLNDYNENAKIRSFAVLGSDNNKIEKEIAAIREDLGSVEDGRGKYYTLNQAKMLACSANSELQRNIKEVDDLLQNKATKGADSIKSNFALYGDINYNRTKLKHEIDIVNQIDYTALDVAEEARLKALVMEETKNKIETINPLKNRFSSLVERVKECVDVVAVDSDKIKEFLIEGVTDWARKGKMLHECQHERCLFCGGIISPERWNAIINHFDEQTEKIIKKIELLVNELKDYVDVTERILNNKAALFYSNYRNNVDVIVDDYVELFSLHKAECDKLISVLNKKKNDLNSRPLVEISCEIVLRLDDIIARYNELVKANNDVTLNKKNAKGDAQEKLRLNAVCNFVRETKYFEKLNRIAELELAFETVKRNRDEAEEDVKKKEAEIITLESQMVDESKGATFINDYLEQLQGCSLKLVAKKEEDGKSVYFQVVRNNVEAKNLSEGERKIIAFCYFLAKLKDVNTDSKKPIIWIDDPICSLDSNHVFFVYSLIRDELTDGQEIEQLFLSTHNLEFLKFLKRLKKDERKLKGKSTWLLLERAKASTKIRVMPEYMYKHVTEFEYLFEQICRCASESIVDDNYPCFYNFGNNARKFLEIYLFFKNPSMSNSLDLLPDFIGSNVAALLTGRINNEMSHLEGGMERSEQLVEYPEINVAAIHILRAIKKEDARQYESLLKSINMADPLCAEVESA